MDLALFDFDHTITTRDTFTDFIHCALSPRRIAFGRALLTPTIVGYRLGVVSSNAIRSQVVRVAFSGDEHARVQEIAHTYARTALPRVARPDMMRAIERHQEAGDTVAVVSASLDLYLAEWCRMHDVQLLCSSLEARDGRLTGRFAGAQCDFDEKARRVRATFDLGAYKRIHAYGDSPGDRAMLALAHRRVFQGQEIT
ncbi:HAD family hydrolase [Cognatilysobacter bugurensis]|uniref:Phosphotransferase n=1 Tax=Cognatilysobacter bugurensis TaxID=543356 RepID=A0A918T016_9GAMM|nr:HAD family hydrolase [Lysobacter bugurensis]GHA80729.1 phosphotransferase [Lysobacter bugurensis]